MIVMTSGIVVLLDDFPKIRFTITYFIGFQTYFSWLS